MTEVYAKAQEFAQRVIAPRAKEIDETDEFPVDVFKKLWEEGWMSLCIPKEFGGGDGGFLEHTEAVYAFSEVSGTVGICYFQHNTTMFEVKNVGTPQLKEEVFNGVVKDGKIAALACSEIGTGCHFYSCQTTSERNADGTIHIKGEKSMVTMAGYASWYCIDCQSLGGPEPITQYLIPAKEGGISLRTADWHGMGMHGNISCPIEIDEDVEEYYRYEGDEGEGKGISQILAIVAPPFILGLSALYGGITTGLSNEATAYAMQREFPCGTYEVMNNKKLCEVESIQNHLGHLYYLSHACKACAFDAAKAMDAGEPDAVLRIMSARGNSMENVIEASKLAMRVVGGKGYNKASNVERMVRDGYAGQVMAPSADVLSLWVGRLITGQSPL